MQESKLISVRLSADDIETIDNYCKRLRYPNRSNLIYAAVHLMAVLVQHHKVDKVFHFRPEFGDVLDEFTLTYHREVK